MSGLKKTNKLLVGLLTAALTAGGVGSAVYANALFFNFGGNKAEEETPVQLEMVEKRDLENSINITGALSSATEVSANADSIVKDLVIKEVKVKMGDAVKAGDVLFTLDTTELEKTLSQEEQKRAVEERKNEIADAQSARALKNTKLDNELEETQALRDIYASEDKLNDSYIDHSLTLDELYNKYGVEDQKYYDAVNAQLVMYDLEEQVRIAYEDPNLSTEELNEVIESYNTAVTTFNTAVTDYESAIKDSISQETTVRNSARGLRDSENSLTKEYENYDKTVRTHKEAVQKEKETIESNNLTRSVSNFDSDNSMEKMRKQISSAIITARTSGIVTAVNANVGEVPGIDAVVITDLNNFTLSCDVDEQYIADIKKGMKCRFTTNATGDDLLAGEVTFVAVTPTKQQTANQNGNGEGQSATSTSGQTDKSRGTYRVLIKATDSNERLRPGMSAKISIITSEAKDVLTVPNQCLGTNINGESVVSVTTDGGATSSEVVVTTGLTDGSYTEVTGNGITEGTQLIVPESIEIAEEQIELY